MKLIEKHPFVMIVIGIMGISLSAIFVRFSNAPSVITAACRLLWTVVLMSPVVWGKSSCRKEILRLKPKELLLCVCSGVLLAVHFVLWFESLQQTSVASSTAIVCTEVIWVAFGYCIFLKGKLTPKAWTCVTVALLGSVLIAFSDFSAGESHLYGDILSLISAISVAVYTLLGRTARKTLSTTAYTYIVYVSCSATLILFILIGRHPISAFQSSAILVGLLLSVFSTIMGHSIFSWCLKYFSPSFISASKLCEPIVAAIFAAILFQEIPVPLQIIGGVIVIAGVFLYSREERLQKP